MTTSRPWVSENLFESNLFKLLPDHLKRRKTSARLIRLAWMNEAGPLCAMPIEAKDSAPRPLPARDAPQVLAPCARTSPRRCTPAVITSCVANPRIWGFERDEFPA